MKLNLDLSLGSKINLSEVKPQQLNQRQSIMLNNEIIPQNDTVSISPLGKSKSIINSLLDQKQKIIETKNELISKTLEQGGDLVDIKTQLKSFEEQLENIDEQIAQISAEQMKQQAEKQQIEIKKETKKPVTEQDAQANRLNALINLSSGLAKTEGLSLAKAKIDGEERVLLSEIKIDETRGAATEHKKERLADLKKQSADLASQLNSNLSEINQDLKNNNENYFGLDPNPKSI